MIATEPEQKRPGLQVGELPFMDPRGSVLSLTGPLAIGDPRVICRPLARLCEKAAYLQRLDLDKLKYDGIYALLGISEDGSVMALSWRDDAWLPTRAPVLIGGPRKRTRLGQAGRAGSSAACLGPRELSKVDRLQERRRG